MTGRSSGGIQHRHQFMHKERAIEQDPSEKVSDILHRKKASLKQAPLPSGAPDWETLMEMTWTEIDDGARANRPGFKTVRKLLTDKRFNK